jgi:hypothetical protein
LFIVSETRARRTGINQRAEPEAAEFQRYIFVWHGMSAKSRVVYSKESQMIFSKDYVGYLARQTVKHLVAEKMIHTEKPAVVSERVAAAMVEELSLEDRINDEVRVILEAFQDDMRKTGASYPEMFKKVKNELARKYKAVL